VILRQLEKPLTNVFLWFFKWAQKFYKPIPFYDNFFFRNLKGTPHQKPAQLVTLAIQWWCGKHYKTTVQDLRYSVETYATKLYKKGVLSENDKLLISEGKQYIVTTFVTYLSGSFHSDKVAQQSYNKPNLSEKDEPVQISFGKLLHSAETKQKPETPETAPTTTTTTTNSTIGIIDTKCESDSDNTDSISESNNSTDNDDTNSSSNSENNEEKPTTKPQNQQQKKRKRIVRNWNTVLL
jgi:hypothetical protein